MLVSLKGRCSWGYTSERRKATVEAQARTMEMVLLLAVPNVSTWPCNEATEMVLGWGWGPKESVVYWLFIGRLDSFDHLKSKVNQNQRHDLGKWRFFLLNTTWHVTLPKRPVNHLEHEWHRNRSCFRKLAAIGQQQQLSVAATVWFRVLRLLRWYLFRRHHSVQWCFCFSHRRSPMTHFIFLIYVVCVQCDGPTDILQKYYI